jgi:hypothetical protein
VPLFCFTFSKSVFDKGYADRSHYLIVSRILFASHTMEPFPETAGEPKTDEVVTVLYVYYCFRLQNTDFS